MGQALAKKEVQEGIKCFQNQSYEVAITKWRRSLHRIRDRQQRFQTLEYLVTAHAQLGQYRDMLAYAVMQIDIANDLDDSNLRAQAYLNLARSSEKLCEYHKAISYARHCIQNKPEDLRDYGAVYLIQGKAYLGISNFTKSLEMLEYAIRISKKCKYDELELLVHTALGELFHELKDYKKALRFHVKAKDVANIVTCTAKYQRLTELNTGRALLKLGKLTLASEQLEVALRSALESEDRAVQARCLCATAHIHRLQHDHQTAMDLYDSAGPLMVAAGDKLGQMDVLKGMARNMEHGKDAHSGDCKALEYNKKALDIAASIGKKLEVLRCSRHMERLYCRLGDHMHEETYTRRSKQLVQELELTCTACGRGVGVVPDSIHLHACFHLAHQRCVLSSSQTTDVSNNSLDICDKCRIEVDRGRPREGEDRSKTPSPRGQLPDHRTTGRKQSTSTHLIRNIVMDLTR